MNKYIITCCSTADLSEEHFKSIEVPFASFTFEMDGKQYVDDLGKSIPFDEFYKKVGAGASAQCHGNDVKKAVKFGKSRKSQ